MLWGPLRRGKLRARARGWGEGGAKVDQVPPRPAEGVGRPVVRLPPGVLSKVSKEETRRDDKRREEVVWEGSVGGLGGSLRVFEGILAGSWGVLGREGVAIGEKGRF